MKKFLITMMCVVMVIAMMPAMAFAEGEVTQEPAPAEETADWYGDGTATEFVLNDKADLLSFASKVNDEGISFNGKTVKLGANIDLAGTEWVPVGQTGGFYAGTYFQGTFDGQSYTISNLTITNTNPGGNYAAGFFGFIDAASATIQNVFFDKATVSGHHWTGVVAGYMTGTIDNCSVTNSIINCTHVNDDADGDKVGGIIGYMNSGTATITGNTVSNCTINGNRDVGGIVGGVVTTATMTNNSVEKTSISYITEKTYASAGLIVSGRTGFVPDETNTATDCIITAGGPAVAKVGETGYNTLADAIAVGGTVTLLDTITLSETIDITKNVVIEGNGNTITSSADVAFVIKDGATATVKDCTINAGVDAFYLGVKGDKDDSTTTATLNINSDVAVTAVDCCAVVYAGTLNTEGALESTGNFCAIQGSGANDNATTVINIKGGSVTHKTDVAIYQPQAGTLNISGGTITGTTAVYVKAGLLDVTGGTIVATGSKAEFEHSNNGCNATGDAIVIEACADGYNPLFTPEISGGTIKSTTNASPVATYEYTEADKAPVNFISGGKYTSDVTSYLASGYFCSKESSAAEAMYIVHTHGTCNLSHEYCAYTCENICHVASHEIYVGDITVPTTPSTPSAPKDDVVTNETTNTGAAGETTVAPTTNADVSASTTTTKTETGEAKTETKVEQTTADKIVENAVANKSEEVVIDATTAPAPTTGTTGTTTPAAETTEAAVVIPTQTIETIAQQTDAAVTIKTDVAEIKLDNAAAAAIAEQAADNGTISIVAVKTDEVVVEEETVTGETEKVTEVHFELKVVCSERGVIGDFQGGTVTVTVPVPQDMHTEELVAVYIDAQGHYHRVTGVKNANGTFTFTTDHFSSYAVMTAEEAEAAIAVQKAAVEDIKFKLSSKIVKRANGKKSVKLTWSDADVEFEGIEIQRSLKKNSGYGKKAYFTTKEGAESYTNTAVKKGTRYYYRARGFVTIDGEVVYTQWSTKAWRKVK